MAPKTPWSEADMARAEQFYRQSSLSIAAIGLECGIPKATILWRVKHKGWRRSPDHPAQGSPGLKRAQLTRTVNAAERRRDLALRALAAAERQMAEIEARGARGSIDVLEEERSARVLSATIRTLRELATLEARAAESARALGLDAVPERPEAPPARGREAIRRDFMQRVQEVFGEGAGGLPASPTEREAAAGLPASPTEGAGAAGLSASPTEGARAAGPLHHAAHGPPPPQAGEDGPASRP